MAQGFANSAGKMIVGRMIEVIHENRAYLSEIDGAIGDGDHGINMDKGFQFAARELAGQDLSLSESLRTLGNTLINEIGGAMGPLYGTMFRRMARASRNVEQIDAHVLASMMEAALEAVRELGNAQVGDKTLVDTLAPAVTAVVEARDRGDDLVSASTAMVNAAEKGWTSTKELVARVGRSARLGERSRGVLDAGATSCYLLLKSMAESMCGLAANDAESRS